MVIIYFLLLLKEMRKRKTKNFSNDSYLRRIRKENSSEEVGKNLFRIFSLRTFRYLREICESSIMVRVKLEDGGAVSHSVTVVGSTPNCDEGVVEPVEMSIEDELVGSADQV